MIEVDGRKFIVFRDADGNVERIKERKIYEEGRPWERIYDQQIWQHGYKMPTRPSSLIQRILRAEHKPNAETVAALIEAREMSKARKNGK